MVKEVMEVFGNDYAKETLFREKTNQAVDSFKLKNKAEAIEDKIERLRSINYKSSFEIKVD